MRFPLLRIAGIEEHEPYVPFSPDLRWRRRRFLVCKIIHSKELGSLDRLEVVS